MFALCLFFFYQFYVLSWNHIGERVRCFFVYQIVIRRGSQALLVDGEGEVRVRAG